MNSKKKEVPLPDPLDLKIAELEAEKIRLGKLKTIQKLEAEIREMKPKGPLHRLKKGFEDSLKK